MSQHGDAKECDLSVNSRNITASHFRTSPLSATEEMPYRFKSFGSPSKSISIAESKINSDAILMQSTEMKMFSVGERVEVQLAGFSWTPGKIAFKNRDKTFDVKLDNGNVETNIEAKYIRVIKTSFKKMYKIGDHVTANFKRRGMYIGGEIRSFNKNSSSYSILYDNGGYEENVPSYCIKMDSKIQNMQQNNVSGKTEMAHMGLDLGTSDFKVGDEIEARTEISSMIWTAGTIQKKNFDRTFHILYFNGKEDKFVQFSQLRRVSASPKTTKLYEKHYKVDEQVEGNYQNKGIWKKCTIDKIHMDGTYDLNYQNGNYEHNIDSRLIRPSHVLHTESKSTEHSLEFKNVENSPTSDKMFQFGDTIEARFDGKDKWHKGYIQKCHKYNSTYDILYANGNIEKNVPKVFIRPYKVEKSPEKNPFFKIGDPIEINFRGLGTWFRGMIKSVNADHTYNVLCDDGDYEQGVISKNIRHKMHADFGEKYSKIESNGATESSRTFQINDEVEANFKGNGRWYKGMISSINRCTGTYEIKYFDGDSEQNVRSSQIRNIQATSTQCSYAEIVRKNSTFELNESISNIKIGQKVEANFQGRGRWFPGIVKKVTNFSKKFDVQYDDGDYEKDMPACHIRVVSMNTSLWPSSGKKSTFSVGQKVEARYRGLEPWVSSKVIEVNSDGTYHIKYDNGREEFQADVTNIQSIEQSSYFSKFEKYPKMDSNYQIGNFVEANYKKKGLWLKGKVFDILRDGTFHIQYLNGNVEIGAKPADMRLIYKTVDQKISTEVRFLPGEEVEAKIAGREKYFDGYIVKQNRDRTYHIKYDNGNDETNVKAAQIRKKTGLNLDKNAQNFTAGDSVEGNFRGKGQWIAGTILCINQDKTLRIRYINEIIEDFVEAKNVRKVKEHFTTSSDSDTSIGFQVNDKIEANYKQHNIWYRGTVSYKHSNGTYDIEYKDGDVEKYVLSKHMRYANNGKKEATNVPSPEKKLKEKNSFFIGQNVKTNFNDKNIWVTGSIQRVNQDGSFNIRYQNGNTVTQVPYNSIRALFEEKNHPISPLKEKSKKNLQKCSDSENSDSSDNQKSIRNYDIKSKDTTSSDSDSSGNTCSTGKISKIIKTSPKHKDNLSDLSVSEKSQDKNFKIGSKIEARYLRRREWISGSINQVLGKKLYSIKYDNGSNEANVHERYIRTSKMRKISKNRLTVGCAVEARYRGKSKFIRGTITRVRNDGTCDIDYDGGKAEQSVPLELIRTVPMKHEPLDHSKKISSESKKFVIGSLVKARYKGKENCWLDASVTKLHKNGTYDLAYENGKYEEYVSPEFIQYRKNDSSSSSSELDNAGNLSDLVIGMRVLIKKDNHSLSRNAKIMHVHKNGTCDVEYDDSSTESCITKNFIYPERKILVRIQGKIGTNECRRKSFFDALTARATRDLFARKTLVTTDDFKDAVNAELSMHVSNDYVLTLPKQCFDKKNRIKLPELIHMFPAKLNSEINQKSAKNDKSIHAKSSSSDSRSSKCSSSDSSSSKSSSSYESSSKNGSSDKDDSSTTSNCNVVSKKAATMLISKSLQNRISKLRMDTLINGKGIDCFISISDKNKEINRKKFIQLLHLLKFRTSSNEHHLLWKCMGGKHDKESTVLLYDFLNLLLMSDGTEPKEVVKAYTNIHQALELNSVTKNQLQAEVCKYDSSNSGLLSAKDFRKCLEKLCFQELHARDLKEIFRFFDPTVCGKVNIIMILHWLFSGFDTEKTLKRTAFLLNLMMKTNQSAALEFEKYNRKGNEEIILDEFVKCATNFGIGLTLGQICCVATHYSGDSANTVNYKKFLHLKASDFQLKSPSKNIHTLVSEKNLNSSDTSDSNSSFFNSSQGAKKNNISSNEKSEYSLALINRETYQKFENLLEKSDEIRKSFEEVTGSNLAFSSFSEFQNVLKLLNVDISRKMSNTIYKCASKNQSVKISYYAFIEFVLCASKKFENISDLHRLISKEISKVLAENKEKASPRTKKSTFLEETTGLKSVLEMFDPTRIPGTGFISVKQFRLVTKEQFKEVFNENQVSSLISNFALGERRKVNIDIFSLWACGGGNENIVLEKLSLYGGLLYKRGVDILRVIRHETGEKNCFSYSEIRKLFRATLGMPFMESELRLLAKYFDPNEKGYVECANILSDKVIINLKVSGKKSANLQGKLVRQKDNFFGKLPAAGFEPWNSRKASETSDYEDSQNGNSDCKSENMKSIKSFKHLEQNARAKDNNDENHIKAKKIRIHQKEKHQQKQIFYKALNSLQRRILMCPEEIDWETELQVERIPGETNQFVPIKKISRIFKNLNIPISTLEIESLRFRFGKSKIGTVRGQIDVLQQKNFLQFLDPLNYFDEGTLRNMKKHLKSSNLEQKFLEVSGGRSRISPKRIHQYLCNFGYKIEKSSVNAIIGLLDYDGIGGMNVFGYRKLVFSRTINELWERTNPITLARLDHTSKTCTNHEDIDPELSSFESRDSALVRYDEELYYQQVDALERAFRFIDEDDCGSIPTQGIYSILRALGHDPTRSELKSIMREADSENNGFVEYNEFQDAVLPYIIKKFLEKKLSEIEIRSMFDSAVKSHKDMLTKEEFHYAFVDKLKILNSMEATALVGLCGKNNSSLISWKEFSELFKFSDDTDTVRKQLVSPKWLEVIKVALLKLSTGYHPNPELYLKAFFGMPSNYRKSILSPFDNMSEFQLGNLLTPQIDIRGQSILPDVRIKLTTTVVEQDRLQSMGKSSSTQDIVSRPNSDIRDNPEVETPGVVSALLNTIMAPVNRSASTRMLESTLSNTAKRATAALGFSQDIYEKQVTNSASLLPCGDLDSKDTLQVVISVKQATGMPIPDDSRAKDICQRAVRTCLFYKPQKSDLNGSENPKWRPEDYFFGNTYKTLAEQDSNREEIWNFPNGGGDSDRKFLVRCNFGDMSVREDIYLFLELTCTVKTSLQAEEDISIHQQLGISRRKSTFRRKTIYSSKKNLQKVPFSGSESASSHNTRNEKFTGKKYPKKDGKKESKKLNLDSSQGYDHMEKLIKKGKNTQINLASASYSSSNDTRKNKKVKKKDFDDEKMASNLFSMSSEEYSEGNEKFDEKYEEIEMSCGWVLLPLVDLVNQSDNGKRLKFDLQGGTPFAKAHIQKSEISNRRYGVYALLHAAGLDDSDKQSKLEIKVISVKSTPSEFQQDLVRLPGTIIVGWSFATILRYYREFFVKEMAGSWDKSNKKSASRGVRSPVLTIFKEIAADVAMQAALIAQWRTEHGQFGFASVNDGIQAFEKCTLQTWLLHGLDGIGPPKGLHRENCSDLHSRVGRARSIVTNSAFGAYEKKSNKDEAGQLYTAFRTEDIAFFENVE